MRILLVCIAFLLTVSTLRAERLLVVSIPDQRLALLEDGVCLARYPVSTSKFGLGDRPRSYATPLGSLEVAGKIGAGSKTGTVFKGGRPTGEVLRPNAPGRDPIVTRILQLRGLERRNAGAYARGIYIHGTPVENRVGRPESYGCIRMRSRDVIALFDAVPVGTRVEILDLPLREGMLAAGIARHPKLAGTGFQGGPLPESASGGVR